MRSHRLGGGLHGTQVAAASRVGFVLNLPMIAPGDRLSAGVVYAKGSTGYAAVTPSGSFQNKFEGANVGFGFWEDGVYAGGVATSRKRRESFDS
jgi:hypothetical protein